MIFSLIKFLILFYVFLIVFATITWNYRPTMYLNTKYDIISKENINTLEENAVYVCQHVDEKDLMLFEQTIICEDVKKSKIKFNIVAKESHSILKFFKELPKFTCYNLIMIKNNKYSNTTGLIKKKLIEEKENILFFLHKNSERKGLYHILKETKKPLVLINMIETERKSSIFNKKFNLIYRLFKNYPIDKAPEDFMKWMKNELYGYYEKLK